MDLHDLNTRNDISKKYRDERCPHCGRRYGEHHYNRFTDAYDTCPWEREPEHMRTFWVCYVEGTDGGARIRHFNLEVAEEEAERLAQLPDVKEKTVYLFECVGKCKLEPSIVAWEVPRR